MNTREYAVKMRKIADFLDSKPAFELPADPRAYGYYFDKEKFLAAAKALGSGTKDATSMDFTFITKGNEVKISIRRDQVCKKVQEAKWECVPLLSAEEVETI